MKIALLTIWHVKNYGAEMQAYATIKALCALGHDVSIIDFRLSDSKNDSLKKMIASLIINLTLEQWKFRKFWKLYFPMATLRYRSLKELQDNPPYADMYLVGSDQVWNEEITKEKAAAFFLDFGKENVIRASYASSIGTNVWNGSCELTEIASKQLKKFKSISCREKSGTEILKMIFGLKSIKVLDPTLLHTDYSELTGTIIQQNKLVYYPLIKDDKIEMFCKELSNELRMIFENINKASRLTRSIIWNRPNIQKWLNSIAESSFVVTPSFHGLSFSLIFHKQFLIIKNTINKDRHCRITDLLKELGLENRFFENVEDAINSKIWTQKIDYLKIDERLSQLRKESFNYIKELFL